MTVKGVTCDFGKSLGSCLFPEKAGSFYVHSARESAQAPKTFGFEFCIKCLKLNFRTEGIVLIYLEFFTAQQASHHLLAASENSCYSI